MESIHKIREIIESKVEHFTDGEYLELMNALMSLSKSLVSEVKNESEDFFDDEEDDAEAVEDQTTLLRWASEHGHIDTVRASIASGADIHADEEIALQRASACGHSDIVRILLESGAVLSTNENYALATASGAGHIDVVKIFLEHGVDLNVGRALHWASANGRSDVVRLLLECGAPNDDRALQLAREYGHNDIVQILTERRNVIELNEYMAALYATDTSEPQHGTLRQDEIVRIMRLFLTKFESTRDWPEKAKICFCLFAFLFQNFYFLKDASRFRISVINKLEEFMTRTAPHLREQGKLEIMEQWLNQLLNL